MAVIYTGTVKWANFGFGDNFDNSTSTHKFPLITLLIDLAKMFHIFQNPFVRLSLYQILIVKVSVKF